MLLGIAPIHPVYLLTVHEKSVFFTASTYSEHVFQAVFRGWRNAQHGKVAEESWSNRVSTTTRGSTGSTDCHVLKIQIMADYKDKSVLKKKGELNLNFIFIYFIY